MGIRNRFRLDLALVYKLLEAISEEPLGGAELRAAFGELGGDKVRAVREWADDLGLTCQAENRTLLTPLGSLALRARNTRRERRVQEIMYFNLATSQDLEVFRALVNSFLWQVATGFHRTFRLQEAAADVQSAVTTEAHPKYIRGEVSTAVNALTSQQALGRLGIVVPMGKGQYRVNAHPPDWRSAAYTLYNSWPLNTARVQVSDVVSAPNSLGRAFLMPEPQVMGLLAKLEQERAIALEIVADLRQIGPNPSMRAEDFLEMLLDA